MLESFILSSAAWALGRLKKPGPKAPGWLFGFEAAEAHIRAYLENQFVHASGVQEDSPLVGRVVNIMDLAVISKCIIEYLELDPRDFSLNLIVRCQPVSFKKYKNTDDVDILNSFFVRDLQRVANEVAAGQCSQALIDYLQEADSILKSRVDIRQQDPLSFCWEKLCPVGFPEACWPSTGHHPLVFSQQIAVNELFGCLKGNSGLVGINGPPGTGKTTLLRDVVAGVILERAKILAKLSSPQEAFIAHKNWKTAAFTRRINIFQESMRGFGMVVASANNGAVENVTLELPHESAIDKSWHDKVDHFKGNASRLLGAPAWGFIAARLGNKANRREFLKRFWYDGDGNEEDLQNGFLSYLKEKKDALVDWKEAIRLFDIALENESRIREARKRTWESVKKIAQLEKQRQEKIDQSNIFNQQRQIVETAKDKARMGHEKCILMLEKARDDRRQHWIFRPTLWMVLLTLGKAYFRWRSPDLEHQRRVFAAEQSAIAAQQVYASANESCFRLKRTKTVYQN